MIYLTSDHHFGHANIVKYTNRPFSYMGEMNDVLIDNWNCRVKCDDEIYHLGDFGMGSPAYLSSVLNRLNGRKYLIRGNHDKGIKKEAEKHFEWVKDYYKLNYNKLSFVLFHYPIKNWDGEHRGSTHLHGHGHSKQPIQDNPRRINVGVDAWNYKPVSIVELINLVEKK